MKAGKLWVVKTVAVQTEPLAELLFFTLRLFPSIEPVENDNALKIIVASSYLVTPILTQ